MTGKEYSPSTLRSQHHWLHHSLVKQHGSVLSSSQEASHEALACKCLEPQSDISQAQTTATSPPSGEVGCQSATPPLEAILPDVTKKKHVGIHNPLSIL